jgi:ribosomal protein S18 acetylase RimI-like enzyme
MSGLDDYRYERMSPEHLQQVVALHEECFPEYYLTNLGPSFLRAVYSWYVQGSEAIAHVAIDRGESVAGFVAGTVDDSNYRRSLFRRAWWPMALALVQRFISNPVLTLRLMDERKELVRQALSTILTGRSREAGQTDVDSDKELHTASLVSIGVKPAARRSGLGAALSELFVREAWDRGCERIILSVRDDNTEARRFYESMDWEEVSQSSRAYHGSFSITYQKNYDGYANRQENAS